MKLLVDIGHPAHVHLFRNAMLAWKAHGHEVMITIRQRDIVAELLTLYGFDFVVASKAAHSKVGMALELLEHDWAVYRLARRQHVDLLIGTSVSVAHVSLVTPAHSIVFSEDDADYIGRFALLTYPFSDNIVIPDCLRDKRKAKIVTYPSYHELAYLHPNHFQPDPGILEALGVAPGEKYFLLRLVALRAHHDDKHRGLSAAARSRLIGLLSEYGRVFITMEGELPEDLRQYQLPIPTHQIHHALAYASMLVSDSQTMTIEAAMLGIPSVRCNTFAGLCSVIEELEHKYDLTYGFHPDEEDQMLEKIHSLLADPLTKDAWQQKRERMLADKIDLAQWMINYVEDYPVKKKSREDLK